jgi:restriction endonuclease BglII
VKIAAIYNHRNAQDILESPKYADAFKELLAALKKVPPYRAAHPKKTSAAHVIDPIAMNLWLTNELAIKGDWDWHPLIIDSDPENPTRDSKIKSDFRKARIEVEVQFGNVARYAYDVYKMAISMSLEKADVGAMVVATKKFADITGGNIAYFERVVRELDRSRMTLLVPVAVIALEPDDWDESKFPPASDAPQVGAADVNAARKRRGLALVPADEPVAPAEDALSLREIKALARRVA